MRFLNSRRGFKNFFSLLAPIDGEEEVLTLEGFPFLKANVTVFLLGVGWPGTIERKDISNNFREIYISTNILMVQFLFGVLARS